MGDHFIRAMRGAVLNGGKPMADFVTVLHRHDALGRPNAAGFTDAYAQAQRTICDILRVDPAIPAHTSDAVLKQEAGGLICGAAKDCLQREPLIDPETALFRTVARLNDPRRGVHLAHSKGEYRLL